MKKFWNKDVNDLTVKETTGYAAIIYLLSTIFIAGIYGIVYLYENFDDVKGWFKNKKIELFRKDETKIK